MLNERNKQISGTGAAPTIEDAPASAAQSDRTPVSAITKRAYELWLERGCPEGSPDEDWYKAESELKPVSHEQPALSGNAAGGTAPGSNVNRVRSARRAS
jgi:hypothetical protein